MVLHLHKKGRLIAVVMVLTLLLAASQVGIPALKRHFYPQSYSDYVEKYCDLYGIDPHLAYAVIHTESGFDSNAVSHLGACGLMQLMPETFDWLQTKNDVCQSDGIQEDIFDPETNIRYGVFFLSMLKAEFNDDRLAIAAYHAGMGRVNQWLGDAVLSPDGKTLNNIPFRDTEHYVRKVERTRKIYDSLYPMSGA